ncbi:MAG TPA: nuclear transport factor 2 family protein [Novosphingobium sp.]|nr:nuclear transport factor 2 family protein [Novosphingobium sp.]
MSGASKGVAAWHAYIGNETAEALDVMLTDDVVFHSPVVHTPQIGRAIVSKYLLSAAKVLNGDHFAYVRELVDGNHALLEFVSEIDGIKINGIDLITFDDDGKIIDFKVMVRPIKAVNKLWEMMAAQLQAVQS